MPPKLAVCHICGREFGRASIDIHAAQCSKKWEAAEALKPERERRPVPQRPELAPGLSPEDANDALRQHWKDSVLEACPHCGRTFLPDRLAVHLRSCRPPPGAGGGQGAVRSKSASRGESRLTSATPDVSAASEKLADTSSRRRPLRPASVVCHICGREFGSASIDIHLPQCERKWQAAEAQKPPAQRRPVPQRPEMEPGMSREQANDKLMEHWNSEVLEPCPHCGRTFLPDRLEVHLRSCRPKEGFAATDGGQLARPKAGYPAADTGRSASSSSPRPARGSARPRSATPKAVRPKAAVCHICGREFGTASISIHVPQCERKWQAAEEQKPPGQRRPLPQKPELEEGLSPEQANEKLLKHWNDQVLQACPHCGRTFLPDRLEVHLRSCRPSSPTKPRDRSRGAVERGGAGPGPRALTPEVRPCGGPGRPPGGPGKPPATARQPPARPQMAVCHICGREFGSASIAIHLPQCERKWEAAEAQRPPAQRRPVPQRPELEPGLRPEEANERLMQNWNDKVLEPCPNCGRTFLPDRLEVHLRSCRPKSPSQPRPQDRGAAARPGQKDAQHHAANAVLKASRGPGEEFSKASAQPPVRPRMVVCHICGREFGTASIDIHTPQCERKWEAAEAKKPEGQRRPVPQRPELEPGLSREKANEKLLEHWNEEVLDPCPHCGRTFLPDRLLVHLRSCRPRETPV